MTSLDQLDFDLSGAGATQCDLIEAELRRNAGCWVPMPHLYHISGAMAVHSRIADLRRKGLTIEHRSEGQRPRRSFYKLACPQPSTLNPQPIRED